MIIDSHVHISNPPLFNIPPEIVIESMQKYNIDISIVSNGDSAECDHNQNDIPSEYQVSQIESINKTIQFAKENKNKIFAALWLKPKNEEPSDELESLIKNNLDVVKALKFHPYHSATPFDSPRIQAYFYLAQKYNLPVITHTGIGNCDNCQLVYKMAKQYPEIKFIMAHLGLASDNLEATELCNKQDNLYGDTAWVPVSSTQLFIQKNGSEKILFGSDNPIDGVDTYHHNPYGQRSIYQDYFFSLQNLISSTDYENLMYKNAKNIFNI